MSNKCSEITVPQAHRGVQPAESHVSHAFCEFPNFSKISKFIIILYFFHFLATPTFTRMHFRIMLLHALNAPASAHSISKNFISIVLKTHCSFSKFTPRLITHLRTCRVYRTSINKLFDIGYWLDEMQLAFLTINVHSIILET